VRTAEVQLQQIGAGILRAANDFVPDLTLRLDHQRSYDRVLRKTFFDFSDLAEVRLNWPIADQLDIVETDHAFVFVINRAVARSGIDDRLANGFPDRSAPAGIGGSHHLIPGICWRTGS